jgi:hypothetical protein
MRHVATHLLALSCAGASLAFQAGTSAQVITGKTPVSPKTAVGSITPKTLTLKPGGAAAAVTVAGNYLENVLSVQVIRGGQSASGMTAKLVPPWPSSGKLEIQAGPGAAVATGYQLRAIVKAGTSQTVIDVPQTVFSLAIAGTQLTAQPGPVGAMQSQTQTQTNLILPDLIVDAIRIDPPNPKNGGGGFGPGFLVYATIKNAGWKEAFLPRGWHLASSRFSGWRPNDFNGFSPTDNVTIPSGTAREFLVYNYRSTEQSPAGTWTVTVRADPDKQILESNEGNNEKSVPVTIADVNPPPSSPGDLIISSLSLDPPDATIAGNFKAVVVVKNQGGSAITLPGNGYPILSEQGDHLVCPQLSSNITLQPGQTTEFRCTPQKLQAGTFTWTVRVDPRQVVAEADENNNTKTMQITIH